MRERARYGAVPSVEKALGSLPVVAAFAARLRIRDVIDGLCPVDDRSELTHGQVIEALVANRLTSPEPLVRVQDWAGGYAVEEVFGVRPQQLNDDRVGRALDAIASQVDSIVGSVGAQAIEVFGIDVSRIHWDMTSFSVYGEYEHAEQEYAVPKFGHPKDRRPDLKQVQAGLAVAADGGVPVFHRAYDGGAGEVAQVIPMMKALQEIATTRRLLIVGDTKLVSYNNLAAMHADKVTFVAPASKVYVSAETLAGLDLDLATPVDYVAARDQGKDPATLGTWHVYEDTMTLAGPRKKDPVLTLRRVFVHSSARAQAATVARAKKLDRATDDLARLTRGLGSRHYPDTAAVETRLAVIAKTRRVVAYLRTTTGTDPDTGKPTLSWHFDQEAIDAEAAGDGWYALLTNLEADQADAAQVLLHYKGQEAVERRYSAFKGTLAVAAIYLKTNRRITAMITVVCLALLIFSLIERQVRAALRAQGRTTVAGLYARRPAVPTTRLIFQALASMRLIPATSGNPHTIPQPTPLQLEILDLLDVNPLEWC
ncbi:IS1634 family transposase [Micromonospora sp. NBC_01638]|uniref:IS1634 family transposase n=1 Tax=Micromonospora sp. NBC_01638 TaxID=2975982 RepID=UPI0038658C51|nr:IS1634 family transposase [Micromonospora sp. NBC_01638]WTD60918.1 IS1634 family transposase [Micromonospora sp. NBC_01638]WTD61081.1 IS1634 family transposase [Micromonospora sp. NBC_01638]